MPDYKMVCNIPNDYTLLQNSQDIESFADHIGREDLKEFACCIFCKQENGEYTSAYVVWRVVPYLLEPVEKLV